MSDYTPAVQKPQVDSSDLVQALADVPDDLSASELKERFDRVPLIVKSSVDDLVDELDSIADAINGKSDSADVYTKAQVDDKLELKADSSSVSGGFNGGSSASAGAGGAVGSGAYCEGGGAVGEGAKAGNGFAGGKNAVTSDGMDGTIDAVQLGTGTNTTAGSLKVYSYTLLNADGSVPPERVDAYTKAQADSKLGFKANTADVYVKTQVDDKLELKADTSSVYTRSQLYTKDELDVKLSLKTDSSEVYTKAQADEKLGLKANSADVYTKTEADSKLGLKANTADVYTKTQVDDKLGLKADSADIYTKTQVDELLEGAGGGKACSTIVMGTSGAGYTAADVDYLCSGSNDSSQFTAALGALPSTGGRILMLEGTYRLQNISITKSGVVIEGMGEGTVIEHAERASGEYTTPIITVGSGLSGVAIKNLKMYGGLTQYDKSLVYAVAASSPMEFWGVVFDDFSSFSNGAVSSISFEGCSGLEIPELGSSNSIKGCDCELGIISGDKNIISDCLLKSCATNYTCYTISGDGNIISGCIIAPEFMDTFMTISGAGNLLSSNTITTSAYTGISVTGAKNIVSSNHIEFTMASSYSTGISVGTGSIACGNVIDGFISGSGTYEGLNITS